MYTVTPNGNGDSSQLVGNDGNSTDNYLLADEAVPDGDTTYVQSATSGQFDAYNVTSIPTLPAGSTIKRVTVQSRSRELTADANSINLGVKGGTGAGAPTTEALSGNLVQGITYADYDAEFTVNPATGVAWTEAEINNMQLIVKVV
jgi:hypothetical protein